MPEVLEFTVDKFTFHVATDRWYTAEGVWAKPKGLQVTVGVSDYLQQRSGDVAFAEVKPAGMIIRQGEELAVIETIKVNISLPSPVSGRVLAINPSLATAPEIINQDPYEKGWLVIISEVDFPVQVAQLIDAHSYYERIKREAEQETRNNG